MTQNIIVLGGGMVGSAMAKDLKISGFGVTVADRDIQLREVFAEFGVDFLPADFTNSSELSALIHNFDFVIGAVPGFMGFNTLKIVIESGKNIVDISFMPEDAKSLEPLAKQYGVTAIVDAGVAPGLSNLYFGHALSIFDELQSAKCYVGGLPQHPQPPWFYKSGFSPIDVIEEYTRPARLVENGEIITKPAMSEIEQINFPGVGELDAFNSDGLRSLLEFPVPDMVEKTLRFPGHVQQIIALRDAGKLNPDQVKETAASLIDAWKPGTLDRDQTIMRLEFSGIVSGESKHIFYNLHDTYDEVNKITSMARTTGYTCTAVLNLLHSENNHTPGVFNLEDLAKKKENVSYILQYLQDRNISLTENSIKLEQEV